MAYLFQSSRARATLGDKAPWSVGWYDHDGRKHSKKIGARSTAEKFRRQVEAKTALQLVEGPARVRWSDFRERFAANVISLKAPATGVAYKRALDNFERLVRPVFVDSITTETVDAYRARRMREPRTSTAASEKTRKVQGGISPATVNKELRHLRAALGKAYRWGFIAKAPEVELVREPERDPYFVTDEDFAALYDACERMTQPRSANYTPADWWRALLCFAYMTGWRISEILAMRREDVDFDAGIATVDAADTKGRRTARVELHPVAVEHLRRVAGFSAFMFEWPFHERALWSHFAKLKTAAGLTFAGAFHRLRFGFANANCDNFNPDVLQRLMRHVSYQTTRGYINAAERMKRTGVAAKLHVPARLRPAADLECI